MKIPKRFYYALLSFVLLMTACSRQNDITELPKSNLRSIVGFTLNPALNYGKVTVAINGTIDQSKKIITLKMPKSTNLTSLRPQLIISPWATVYPNNLDSVDLTKDTVEYTVTSESGLKSVYGIVKDFSYKYPNATIFGITFAGYSTRFAVGSTNNFTLPITMDKTALNVSLEFASDSQNATVFVKENGIIRPFTNPVDFSNSVQFLSRSESSTSTTSYNSTYTISLTFK